MIASIYNAPIFALGKFIVVFSCEQIFFKERNRRSFILLKSEKKNIIDV